MEQLEGRVAVVTGAASGIGRALAERFVAEGMSVVAADVEPAAIDGALALRTDVSDPEAVEALAVRTWAEYGRCHLVCANAGVFQGGITWARSLEDWQWVLGVNVWGPIHVVRSFVSRMVDDGDEGHVVITSSMAGLICAAFSGPYQTSKFAAYALAESVAHDVRSTGAKLGVSVLCPGAVDTRIAESHRNRPAVLGAAEGEDAAFVDGALAEMTEAQGCDPSEVAERVVAAVRSGEFLIPTNEFYVPQIQRHTDALLERRLPPMAEFS